MMRLLVLGVAAVACAGAQSPPRSPLAALVGTTVEGRVTHVADGDTVTVRLARGGQTIRVRLEGVDAPERGEPFSTRARTFARELLFDQVVRVDGRDVDRYGRLVARLVAQGRDASVELIAAGLACHYTVYASDPRLARAQDEARRAGRGFWAADASKPRCTRGRR